MIVQNGSLPHDMLQLVLQRHKMHVMLRVPLVISLQPFFQAPMFCLGKKSMFALLTVVRNLPDVQSLTPVVVLLRFRILMQHTTR